MKYKALLILLIASILTGCGAISKSTPLALPTVVLEGNQSTTPQASASSQPSSQPVPETNSAGGATASGVIVPAQEAQLSAAAAGNVKTVDVSESDQVKAGQVLIHLAGDEQLQAAASKAALDVLSAQQDVDNLQRGAALAAAQAQLALVQAQKALDDAKQHRLNLDYRASPDQVAAANANYILAQNEVDKQQERYDNVAGRPEDDATRALALANLENAKKARDKAKINLNWYKGKADPKDIAEADANVSMTQAKLNDAQTQLNNKKDGPDPDQMALLQAKLKSAQDAANAAHAALADLELTAPFDGTVSKISTHSGEWVIPGTPVLVLVDLNHMQIETTDLSERDVPRIKIGMPVTAQVKALNQTVKGHVTKISPLADTLGGDVVYKTTIDLDSPPTGLRAGMSVDVTFGSGS